jgi:hypothetical protein
MAGEVNNSELEPSISIPELRAAVYVLRVVKNNEALSNFKLLKY